MADKEKQDIPTDPPAPQKAGGRMASDLLEGSFWQHDHLALNINVCMLMVARGPDARKRSITPFPNGSTRARFQEGSDVRFLAGARAPTDFMLLLPGGRVGLMIRKRWLNKVGNYGHTITGGG